MKLASLATLSGFAAAKTVYTGDTFHGYHVISSLDLADVPPNTISRYYISAAPKYRLLHPHIRRMRLRRVRP